MQRGKHKKIKNTFSHPTVRTHYMRPYFTELYASLFQNLHPTAYQLQQSSFTFSIECITNNWIAEGREMHSDLMPHSLVNHHTDDTRITYRIVRHRRDI